MQLGLFLRRALIALARRGTVFQDRVAAVIVAVAIVTCCVAFWDWTGWDRTTIAGARRFGLATFGVAVSIQALLAMAIAGLPSIAEERDRKSFDSLLATGLSSTELVLGMMGPGLVRSANWLAATTPVIVLIATVGGVPSLLVVLTAVGAASSAFAASAIGVTVSAYAPNRLKARDGGIGMFVAWIDFPLLFEFLRPRVWPRCPRWLAHASYVMIDSSPIGVGISTLDATLIPRPFGLIEALIRMIVLQVFGSTVLVLWAALQLRAASRALHDGEWSGPARWIGIATRRRPRPRIPCGDDPVLWNEIHSQQTSSLAGRAVAVVGQLVGIGVLALGTSWFALPAFTELAERGYGAVRAGFTMPEVNPLARVLIDKLLIPAGSVAPGQARLEFNMALRQFSALFVMLYVVMVCGTAAMSVILERERDTWRSLVTTTLTPWEILRAKMLAAIWRARPAGLTLIALWTVGLLAGALHPLGLLNAVAGLIAIGALYAAVGVSMGLQVGQRKQIDSMIILLVLCVLPLSGLAILLPGTASVFLGACSTPFLTWSSLFSYEDVQSLVRSGVLPQLGVTSIKPGVSARMVLAACWIAVIVHAVGAFFLTRSTCRRFDALVGRPVRSRNDARVGTAGW
jgi:ABC-type Na+ efflux pump permease subunit